MKQNVKQYRNVIKQNDAIAYLRRILLHSKFEYQTIKTNNHIIAQINGERLLIQTNIFENFITIYSEGVNMLSDAEMNVVYYVDEIEETKREIEDIIISTFKRYCHDIKDQDIKYLAEADLY